MFKIRSKGLAVATAAAVLAIAGASSSARAVPIVGDYSYIDITSSKALTSAGVTLSALGAAQLFTTPLTTLAYLPVTGGDVDLPTSFLGTIEHAGSGLRLTFAGVDLDLTNLVINTLTNQVTTDFASGALNGTTDFFDISACDSGAPGTCATLPAGAVIPTGLRLAFSANGAAVIQTFFGVSGLAGVQFGVANTAIRAVPEPGTAMLLGSALVALAASRRQRRA